MNIGIPKESLAGETRVACTPATVTQLQKLGFAVVVERGAGQGASLADAAYEGMLFGRRRSRGALGRSYTPSDWQQ